MKKMNILFILITTILIFGTTNAFALSYDYNVGNEVRVYTGNKNVTLNIADYTQQNTYKQTDVKFDNDNGQYSNSFESYGYDFPNSQFVRIAYSGALYSFNSTGMNINLSETCSQQTDGVSEYTVTYADGSHAAISRSQWQTFCYNHSISGSTGFNSTLINELQPRVILVSNGEWSQCEMENGFILCPVKNNTRYFYLRFEYKTYQVQDVLIKYDFRLHASMYTINTDTQAIINNNNQNTQTIVNNITTPSIDSNTTNTDSLITIPNSNGKNVVLDLLMTPVNLFTNIINSFSNSCVSYNLGNLLGTNLILPCVNLQNILGSSLYTIIDSIFAFGMLFAFIRSVKKFIQKALLLASDVSSEVSVF